MESRYSINGGGYAGRGVSLVSYFKKISRYAPLSSKEECDLAVRIKQGDEKALHKLVKSNLRFVVSVAKNYQHQGVELPDLINEGNIGLIRAAYRFDEKKNFRFISYAVWWVRQAVLQALADQSRIVRLPLNQVGNIHRLAKQADSYMQKHKRMPDSYDLAGQISDTHKKDISVEKIDEMMSIRNTHTSLDDVVGEGLRSTLGDRITYPDQEMPGDSLDESYLKVEVNQVIGSLDDREKDIIKMYFGICYDHPYILDDISIKLNISRERVRQIKDRALQKVKAKISFQKFREYMQ